MQSLLRARTAKMTRHVQHAHHLKGLLHCGTCGSRMLLDFTTNPRGTTYAYFVCSGRAAKKTTCTPRAMPVAVAERLVAGSYASIAISDATYRDLAAQLDAAFDARTAGRYQEIADLMANRAKLESECDRTLAAHFADAIDLPTLKRHQDRIRAGLADVNRRLAEHDAPHRRPGVPARQPAAAHRRPPRVRPIRRRQPQARLPSVLRTARHHRRRTTPPTPGRTVRHHHP
ncbi:MAG: zinc ribbon domain-containing protein [Nocardioidaceae bacterium]